MSVTRTPALALQWSVSAHGDIAERGDFSRSLSNS